MRVRRAFWMIIMIAFLSCSADPADFHLESNFMRGLEKSQQVGKPMLLVFSGYGVKCCYGEFSNYLLTSKRIQNILNEDYVTVRLLVDDQEEIRVSDTLGSAQLGYDLHKVMTHGNIRNIGNFNSRLQVALFRTSSQPFYAIMNPDRELLMEPFGYTGKDKGKFISKLWGGLNIVRAESQN